MGTWSGWQADLLSFAHLPNTTENRNFLSDWNAHAETNCANNPVDLSVPDTTSSDCASLPGLIPKAQRYTTHGNGAHAFNVQVHQSRYAALLSAMETGDPYTTNNTGEVAQDIALWGSRAFSQRYFDETKNAPGRGSGGDGISAPRAHKGWHDIRRSVNHNWPRALKASERQTRAALRRISHARKVRL